MNRVKSYQSRPLKIWPNAGSDALNATVISVPVANANPTILGSRVKKLKILRVLVNADIVPKKSKKHLLTNIKHFLMYVVNQTVSPRSRTLALRFMKLVNIHATEHVMSSNVCNVLKKTASLSITKRIKTISSYNYSMDKLLMTSVLYVIPRVLVRWRVSDFHVDISSTSSVS